MVGKHDIEVVIQVSLICQVSTKIYAELDIVL